LIRCVCGKKIGPDPRNFNQRVSLGRNDLLIRTFPNRMLSNHTTASLQNKYFLTATFLIQRTRSLPISSYTQATTIRHALLLLEPYIPPQCCYAISEKMAKEI
ncbi:hypothetical protein ACP8VL_25230, partial [Klebsiella pneumoniae]